MENLLLRKKDLGKDSNLELPRFMIPNSENRMRIKKKQWGITGTNSREIKIQRKRNRARLCKSYLSGPIAPMSYTEERVAYIH